MTEITVEPFLKWVGGKTQICDDVINLFPAVIERYYEPFIGGGSILIKLLNLVDTNMIKIKKFQISDINKTLILTYHNIKHNPEKLIQQLTIIKDNYFKNTNISAASKGTSIQFFDNIDENILKGCNYVYYFYRDMYNKLKKTIDNLNTDDKCKLSALFIFLNKTCFRGLYRENSSGEFNVPFGNYSNPSIYDKNNITNLSKLFKKYKVKFKCLTFDTITVKNNSFVYLDPPYYPENSNSFVDYNGTSFNLESNNKLLNMVNNLNDKNIKFVLSNSDTQWINDNYNKYNINKILCKRKINSKNPKSTVNEVIIKNY
jgi:DNA adenine methylase